MRPQAGVYCQVPTVPDLATGDAEVPRPSLRRRIQLVVRRHLTAKQVRTIKERSNRIISRFLTGVHREQTKPITPDLAPGVRLAAGDWVRIRSEEEIAATLDHWGKLKGCMFMPEMLPYCGSTRQVFKRVDRFVDEHDYRVKRGRGVVLLDGLICTGTSHYGRCDRSCFYFWREEWLEKVEGPDGALEPR